MFARCTIILFFLASKTFLRTFFAWLFFYIAGFMANRMIDKLIICASYQYTTIFYLLKSFLSIYPIYSVKLINSLVC